MRVLFANPLPREAITKEGRVIIPLNVTLEPLRLPLSMCLAADHVREKVPGSEVHVADCQAEGMDAAVAIASAMWGANERSSRLPGWDVVGLQVLDRQTYLQHEPLRALPPEGRIAPF